MIAPVPFSVMVPRFRAMTSGPTAGLPRAAATGRVAGPDGMHIPARRASGEVTAFPRSRQRGAVLRASPLRTIRDSAGGRRRPPALVGARASHRAAGSRSRAFVHHPGETAPTPNPRVRAPDLLTWKSKNVGDRHHTDDSDEPRQSYQAPRSRLRSAVNSAGAVKATAWVPSSPARR